MAVQGGCGPELRGSSWRSAADILTALWELSPSHTLQARSVYSGPPVPLCLSGPRQLLSTYWWSTVVDLVTFVPVSLNEASEI